MFRFSFERMSVCITVSRVANIYFAAAREKTRDEIIHRVSICRASKLNGGASISPQP